MQRRIVPALIAGVICFAVAAPALADTIYLPLTSSAPVQVATTPTPTNTITATVATNTPTRTVSATFSPSATPFPEGIRNGDFEQGNVAWERLGVAIPASGANIGHNSNWAGVLGGTTGTHILSQRMTIPYNVFFLSFWYQALSTNASCTTDRAYVWIDPDPSNPNSSIKLLTSITDFCATKQHLYQPLTLNVFAYSGKAVELNFELDVDSATKPIWTIDDIAFRQDMPTAIPPTPTQTLTPIRTATPTATVDPAATPTTSPYYTGGQDLYDCTNFSTWSQANAVYQANRPGDPNKLDSDGDGIPCESLPGAP